MKPHCGGRGVGPRVRRVSVAVGMMALTLGACQADGRDGRRGAEERPMQPVKRDRPEVTDVSAEDYPAPELPRATVVLQDAFGGRHAVEVEVAANDPMRTRGLMWRRELPGGKGMLFIFPGPEEVRSFWMRNTLIPLDMLFIDGDGLVVGIVENAEPRTLGSRSVGRPSKYVLEVPGGWTREKGIRPGSTVQFHGLGAIPVE